MRTVSKRQTLDHSWLINTQFSVVLCQFLFELCLIHWKSTFPTGGPGTGYITHHLAYAAQDPFAFTVNFSVQCILLVYFEPRKWAPNLLIYNQNSRQTNHCVELKLQVQTLSYNSLKSYGHACTCATWCQRGCMLERDSDDITQTSIH